MVQEGGREALGARLREAREYRGFSQDEVARHLGIPRSAVSLIETGSRRVEALELQRLAQLFDCSMEELTGSPEPTRDESVRLLARAAAALSADDQREVLRFAEYLRAQKPKE